MVAILHKHINPQTVFNYIYFRLKCSVMPCAFFVSFCHSSMHSEQKTHETNEHDGYICVRLIRKKSAAQLNEMGYSPVATDCFYRVTNLCMCALCVAPEKKRPKTISYSSNITWKTLHFISIELPIDEYLMHTIIIIFYTHAATANGWNTVVNANIQSDPIQSAIYTHTFVSVRNSFRITVMRTSGRERDREIY